MGLYNIVRGSLICPRCNIEIDAEIETRLGDMSQIVTLNVGEKYPWRRSTSLESGGRPENGNAVGDGYCECPNCRKDFFVRVVVENDVICRLEIDDSRKGYIP